MTETALDRSPVTPVSLRALHIAAQRAEPARAVHRAADDAAQLRPARILIADDDELVRRRLRELLEAEGHQAWTAASGEQAIELARLHEPDLVLLDVTMPGMDGYEVCRRLDPTSHAAPLVIFVSGLAEPADRIRGLQTGAIDYIGKPFRLTELRARIQAALRTKARIDALVADASTDPLTGLANRALLARRIPSLVAAAERYGHQLSCLMVDVDAFKAVNDQHGHDAGDDVLRQTAGRIRRLCRTADLVARYGGEEFLVVAPETPVEATVVLATRIHRAIRARRYVVRSFGRLITLPLTVSIGIAHWEPGMTADELIGLADAALLGAKRGGRDRIIVAEAEFR